MLRDLFVRIKGDKTSLDSTLKGAEGSVNKFSGVVKRLGGMIAAAFGIQAIANFTKEAVKLSAQMEGIQKGFEQIAAPGLLDELRKATKGTVSDMQLMSRAVQASNFQIPLKDLSKLLEFASARAVQTGQSVEYLVDSIVLGIGRKSPLILDNLGISAVRLRQLLKGPGVEMATVGDIAAAVGNIAEEELQKMGGMAETTGVKLQQLAASWENLKSSIGKTIIETKAFQTVLSWIQGESDIWKEESLSFWEKFNGSPEEFKKWKKNQEEAQVIINENTNKLFPGLISALKDVKDKTDADAIASAALAEKLQKEALAAEEAAKAAKLLSDARAELSYSPTVKAVASVSPSVQPFDPEAQAARSAFAKQTLDNLGGNELRGAPNAAPSKEGLKMIAEANAELADMVSEMEELLTNGRDMALDMGAQMLEALGQALTGNTEGLGKNLLSAFANFLSQFGKMLLLAGLGIEAFVKSTATLNPALAIGAGIAMMIAAGAVRGVIQGGTKSVASGSSGGSSSSSQSVSNTIELKGVLRGSDIYLSGVRYGRSLSTGT